MAGRIAGKVAIVTGGGRGIGRAIAILFGHEGAQVTVANRTDKEGTATVKAIVETGGEAIFCQTDVAKEEDVQHLIATVIDRYGHLDVLVNNAGTGLVRPVTESTAAEWHFIMDTNLTSVFFCCKYALPEMMRQGGGSIVNVASVASYVAFPGDAAYCSSKGGLLMLTKQTALDYARHNVRVNAICPGFVATPEMEHYLSQQPNPEEARKAVVSVHPLGRVGTPEEIAYAALFLASDESSFMTGAPLIIDGGLLVQ